MPTFATILMLPLQVAIAAPPAPPAPVFSTPRPIQPMMLPAGRYDPRRRVPLHIVVRSFATIVWQGPLIVAERGSSTWMQTRQEPEDEACGRDTFRYGDREGLNVQLGLLPADDATGPGDRVDRISVSVRWTRPADGPCAGTRTVEVRRVAVLTDRRPVVFQGDGGLVVEVRPR